MFDCDIWMPVEMESYKQGENFLWASSNLNDLNFVMYAYPFRDHDTFTKEYFIHKRDSVMKVNLPGAREGMYMENSRFYLCRDAQHCREGRLCIRGPRIVGNEERCHGWSVRIACAGRP